MFRNSIPKRCLDVTHPKRFFTTTNCPIPPSSSPTHLVLRMLSNPTTSHIHMLQQSRQRFHLVLTTWASVQPGNPVRVLRRLEVLVELFQGRKVESGAKVTIVPVVGVLCILGCHVLLIRIKSRRFLVSDLDHRTRDSLSCSI